MRIAHKEMCFTKAEFRALDFAQICRRYGLGDGGWVDEEADKRAAALAVAPK